MSATISRSRHKSHQSYFLVALSLTLAGTVSACAPKSQFNDSLAMQEASREAVAAELSASGKNVEAAEQYAVLGEMVIRSKGIEAADPVFKKALGQDTNNRRANFYSSLTKPLVALNGFLPRVETLLNAGNGPQLEKVKAQLENLKLGKTLQFIQTKGNQREFETTYDLQRYLRTTLLPLLLESADKLEKVSAEGTLELGMNVSQLGATHLSSNGAHTVLMQDDFKTMRGAMMAIADDIRLKTAYSLEGLEEIQKTLKKGGKTCTTREVVALFMESRPFLKLERDQQLSELAASGVEVLKHAMDLATAQSELCGRAVGKSCEGAGFVQAIQNGIDLLAGPREIAIGNQMVLIDVTRLLADAPKDLKDFLPKHFDRNGEAIGVPDKTMGGLFPNGDIVEKIKALSK